MGAETALHSALLDAGVLAFSVALPVTTRVQPGAANNAVAVTVAHSKYGNRIAPHHTFGTSAVKHPASATGTKSSAPP